MKTILFVSAALFVTTSWGKTCRAVLDSKIKSQEIFMTAPSVFYPNDDYISRFAKWMGNLETKAFVQPPAIEIECGKPRFTGTFEGFTGTGLLPKSIETYEWITTGWDGNPKVVPPEILYGIGDSYAYPSPPVWFTGIETETVIDVDAPEGVKDICDLTYLPLPDTFVSARIEPDNSQLYYQGASTDGYYRWDVKKSPKDMPPVDLELVNRGITIMCDHTWEFEMTMEWPYKVAADDDSLCGPGEVNRKMEVKGFFMTMEDNKVQGFIEVPLPTVTYSGNLWGSYTGKPFSQKLNGYVVSDEAGNRYLDIEMFEGGDGIQWNYAVKCPYGEIKNSLFAAVWNYFQIYNGLEESSIDNAAHLRFPAEGDTKTYSGTMGGQGTVTFTRTLKKNF